MAKLLFSPVVITLWKWPLLLLLRAGVALGRLENRNVEADGSSSGIAIPESIVEWTPRI